MHLYAPINLRLRFDSLDGRFLSFLQAPSGRIWLIYTVRVEFVFQFL